MAGAPQTAEVGCRAHANAGAEVPGKAGVPVTAADRCHKAAVRTSAGRGDEQGGSGRLQEGHRGGGQAGELGFAVTADRCGRRSARPPPRAAVPPSKHNGRRSTCYGALLLSPGPAAPVYGLTGMAHGRALPAVLGVSLGPAVPAGFTVHGLRARYAPLAGFRLSARRPGAGSACGLVPLIGIRRPDAVLSPLVRDQLFCTGRTLNLQMTKYGLLQQKPPSVAAQP